MSPTFASGAFDLTPAPGRYPFHLSPRWTAVVLVPVPGVVAVGLFLDGEPVEVIDEQEDVLDYVDVLMARTSGSSYFAS